VVRRGLEQIIAWSSQILLTDGEHLTGLRFNRLLHYLARDHTFDCPKSTKAYGENYSVRIAEI